MIGIHPVHRRMAEIHQQAKRVGGYDKLPQTIQAELHQCVAISADIVVKLDSLKELSFHAYEIGDLEWNADICKKIDELEAQMI